MYSIQQQHEPLLAELSHLEQTFPHLDFSTLVARINTSLTKDDYGYSRIFGAAAQIGSSGSDDSNCAVPDNSPVPGTIYDLQHIFADPAEAAAICEYYRLDGEQAANQHSLARHNMRALEEAFPHLDFPAILRIALTVFPEYFDHVSGAAAQHTGPNPIS